jgi:uncharacterized protein (TIGR02588 family)
VALALSAAVLLLFAGLIATQIPGHDDPAAPTAQVEQVRPVGDAFQVDVSVGNAGDTTAANVQVSAELTANDESFTGDQTIDFLAGGEEHDLSFVFPRDPRDGELRVVVTGFAVP